MHLWFPRMCTWNTRASHRMLLGTLLMIAMLAGSRHASLAQTSPIQDKSSVDLLLVLAADISRSVDAAKFKLQRDGYAQALTHPRAGRSLEKSGCGIEKGFPMG